MSVTEIAPDLFRLSLYVPEMKIQFNQFLVRDDEPLLFHTGMKGMFPHVREEVASVIDPSTLKWIGFSHFEADECGSLNEWLAVAPQATAVCSFVGANVSVNDFASRPAKALNNDDVFSTGKYKFRFLATPHVPHCWEASLLYEETQKTLFCSDLFFQSGEAEPKTESDLVGKFKEGLVVDQKGPFANAYPYTSLTDSTLRRLAALKPKTIAVMHGSSFVGNGEAALNDLAAAMKEVLDSK